MSDQNKAAARAFLDAFSSGDTDSLGSVMADDYVDHDAQNPFAGEGLAGAKKTIELYRAAFSDLHFTIEDQIAEGDRVVTRWTAAGTQDGELMGAPASGKSSTVTGISIDRMEDGKAVEGWTNWDTLGMMQQVGLIPEAEAAQA